MDIDLGDLEPEVEELIQSGRYASRGDLLREGVRLLLRQQELERLEAELAPGIEDAQPGRLIPADVVFDRLISKYEKLASQKS